MKTVYVLDTTGKLKLHIVTSMYCVFVDNRGKIKTDLDNRNPGIHKTFKNCFGNFQYISEYADWTVRKLDICEGIK